MMQRELDRIGRMVDQYLIAGQLQHRPLCLEVEEVDTAALVAEVVHCIVPWAGEQPSWNVESGLCVWADQSRLEQVIWNVLQNAYRYGKRPIEIRAWAEDDDARIVITDCGAGILGEQRSVATSMFKQGHDAHRDGLGIGLGLSTAIVEAPGGRLWIERAACGGAAVHIALERAGQPWRRLALAQDHTLAQDQLPARDGGRAASASAGMHLLVHLTQVLVGELRVHLRGGDVGVAEQLLHVSDGRAAAQQVGGEGVAQRVWRDV